MVRHYIKKHEAWQPYIWTTYDKEYSPDFKPTYADAPKEAETLGYIVDQSGEPKEPGSREEYRVYQALDYFNIPFFYQYSIAGGRRIRGGQIIDYYCETVPQPTLVYVQGTYWHTGTKGAERQLAIAQAASYFGNEVRVVEIWDYEIPTVDDAIAKVKERVL